MLSQFVDRVIPAESETVPKPNQIPVAAASPAGASGPVLYTSLVSPDQEQLVCDALVHLGPMETEQGLHAEGVRTIQEVLHCTLDDARATLRELRVRKRIEETTAPLEHLDQPHFRWVRHDEHEMR